MRTRSVSRRSQCLRGVRRPASGSGPDSPDGGLVGGNWGTVSNSYSTVNVRGSGGGLVRFTTTEATVRNCYSVGSLGCELGGCGLAGGGDADVVHGSFWDIWTSGQAYSQGGTGKTTAEMMDIATFADTETDGLDEPWDIVAVALDETNPAYIWNIVDGQTYPFLSWQPGP